MSGILIYTWNRALKLNYSVAVICLISGVLLFVYYPMSGPKATLIVGYNKMLFTMFCILITWSSLNIGSISLKFVHNPLKWLGEISYSVYLLHPLVWKGVTILNRHFAGLSNFYVKFILGLILTLILSHFVYNYYEKLFAALGKKFLKIVVVSES